MNIYEANKKTTNLQINFITTGAVYIKGTHTVRDCNRKVTSDLWTQQTDSNQASEREVETQQKS